METVTTMTDNATQSSATDPVLFAVEEGVATITLNRPDMLNAMNNGLMRGLHNSIDRVAQDDSIRVVILTGNGRGFCAGADLAQSAQAPDKSKRSKPPKPTASMEEIFNPAIRALADCPVPTIARINGAAAGGGFGLALTCDISIAARSAFFVATFGPRLGIVPDMGLTWHAPLRAGRARALGLSLLGDRITADQAEHWGLIWRTVDDDQLDNEVARTADILKNSSPNTSARIRQSIDAAFDNSFSEQLDVELAHQEVLLPRNMKEGATAFMEKRPPRFGGERE